MNGWQSADNKFFRFARQYPLTHPELAWSFEADGSTLGLFRDFVALQSFDYVSAAEAGLAELDERFAEEAHYDQLQGPLQQLRQQIDAIEEEHWVANAGLLRWQLSYEILEKTFGIEAAIAYDVRVDPVVDKARALIADGLVYEEWLQKAEIGQDVAGSIAADSTSTEGNTQ